MLWPRRKGCGEVVGCFGDQKNAPSRGRGEKRMIGGNGSLPVPSPRFFATIGTPFDNTRRAPPKVWSWIKRCGLSIRLSHCRSLQPGQAFRCPVGIRQLGDEVSRASICEKREHSKAAPCKPRLSSLIRPHEGKCLWIITTMFDESDGTKLHADRMRSDTY